MDIEPHRKKLGQNQTRLRELLTGSAEHHEAMALFLDQHAQLHAAGVSGSGLWSFEDALLEEVTAQQFSRIPSNQVHSMAWCIWHIARIEDISMNMLVGGGDQIYDTQDWRTRLGTSRVDSGNAMDAAEIAQLSAELDLAALRAYRAAVGRRTRQIAAGLDVDSLRQKVDPRRLQRVAEAGAVVPEASGVLEYWGRRSTAGLLLMPASRHNLTHLNEAYRLKRKLR